METLIIKPVSANKDVVQSFKLTTIRNDFGIYGQRVLLHLVNATQDLIEGKKIGECRTYQVNSNLWGERQIILPVSAILAEGDKSNYQEARKQIKKLASIPLEYEKSNGIWTFTHFLSRVDFNRSTAEATIQVQPEVWELLMDFSKGFRRFELAKAMQLKSVYSLRLYELISGQEQPLRYTIENLKKMFGLEKKYPRPVDFVKRVICPAKEELDKVAPYSFDFKPILERKTGRGKPGIVGITFFPLYQPKNRDKELAEKADYSNIQYKYPHIVALPQGIKNYLMQCFGFTETGIKNNEELFNTAIKYFDLDKFLRKIVSNARKAKNPQGYVIRAIKSELKENGVQL